MVENCFVIFVWIACSERFHFGIFSPFFSFFFFACPDSFYSMCVLYVRFPNVISVHNFIHFMRRSHTTLKSPFQKKRKLENV